jgi:mRNA interferase MazF
MVMASPYTPRRGDIVWLCFDPQAGHEQAGRRPAFVLSAEGYNKKTGLCIACPVTSKIKGYPFEVLLPKGLSVEGAVLADQVKNLDWRVRNAQFACAAPSLAVEEVVARILPLIDS